MPDELQHPSRRRARYAQVGIGLRSWVFSIGISQRGSGELVALCDSNPGRLAARLDWAKGSGFPTSGYAAEDFDEMLAAERPDWVIVTSPDHTHARYVCRALEAGCNVVSEKPLTIDAESLQHILDAQRASGRELRVAFNYRYSPPRAQVKRLLQEGAIGEVLSVDFHWLLDTTHGADYFRRWHRNKSGSGGLLVHKASHHFDLVNWWLDSVPKRVFASGHRRYYTAENAEALGLGERGERCLGCPAAERCPFHLDIEREKLLKLTYRDHEHHDGYFRDRCVFDAEIDIEDTMNVLVDYRSGARMSYSLNASVPREGYTVAFNGTRGRLDHSCVESSYVSGKGGIMGELDEEETRIVVQPHFGRAREIPIETGEGGHGGGDALLLEDLFSGTAEAGDPLGRRADQRAGAWSILTGIAANRSIATGEAVEVGSLVSGF